MKCRGLVQPLLRILSAGLVDEPYSLASLESAEGQWGSLAPLRAISLPASVGLPSPDEGARKLAIGLLGETVVDPPRVYVHL